MLKTKTAQLHLNKPDQVDEFMDKLEHPFKAEIQTIRRIIKSAHKQITEQIKWNAPSFSYRDEYLVTFNLRATQHVHLVFHYPGIVEIKNPLLEGDYPNRRMAYFSDLKDVRAKKAALEKIMKECVRRIDAKA